MHAYITQEFIIGRKKLSYFNENKARIKRLNYYHNWFDEKQTISRIHKRQSQSQDYIYTVSLRVGNSDYTRLGQK